MKLHAIVLVTWFLLCLQAWGEPLHPDTKLTPDECRSVVKDFESMSNLTPGEVEAHAPAVLDRLHNGETLTSYFVAYNIYAENLFNKGNVEKAKTEIEKMMEEAANQDRAECKVIALRTEGQFYYKLGLYERAAECFREAMKICPRYDSSQLDHCFTWSSTLFWLVQADIHSGSFDEAERWIKQMDPMMQWLQARGETDQVGYKPVMIRGLKAKIKIGEGDLEEAHRLLLECPPYIRPDIPSRAYVEYYVAKMQLYVKEGRHKDALPILDDLIEMHINDYKPIAAEFIYQKGLSLAELGRYEESSAALREYIKIKGETDKVAAAQQLDELNTQYEVEKLQHERDNIYRQLLILLAICVALAIIVSLIVLNHRKLQRKNRILADNISELSRISRENAVTVNAPQTEPKESPSADAATSGTVEPRLENVAGEVLETEEPTDAELVETGNRVVEYINRTRCFLRSECGRDTIKEGMGISERTLAKAVVAATGKSFVNYINQLRLDVSIQMLEEEPDMTINDISAACGFGTVRQFQRLFKQRYDLTPSAYRDARLHNQD